MEIFKRFLGLDQKNEDDDKRKKKNAINDEFRRPVWVEEYDTDDELFDSNKVFGFQIFTNPSEVQKHFEGQIQEMMKSFEDYNEHVKFFDQDINENFLKPGFEREFEKDMQKKKLMDNDLDGEIYTDQLKSLLQRISPDLKAVMPKNEMIKSEQKLKKSDEEKVMDKIHGNIQEEIAPVRRKRLPPPRYHEGVFEGTFQGPRMFGQSIISQTVRKPDGTYETRKTVRDSEGHSKTTIIRSKDGQTEVISTIGDKAAPKSPAPKSYDGDSMLNFDPNFFCTKDGYTLPKNLW